MRHLFEEYEVSQSENSVLIEAKQDEKGSPFSFAFVVFENEESAKQAVNEMNYTKIDGFTIRLIVSDKKTKSIIESKKTAMVISNLDPSIDEIQLHETLQDYGDVITCKIFVSDECAMAYFRNKKDTKNTYNKLKKARFEGRKISIQLIKEV